MNIAAIKRNCMATKTAFVLKRGNIQWISNGMSAFLVEGIHVDTRAIVSLFNLSPKQEDKMTIWKEYGATAEDGGAA